MEFLHDTSRHLAHTEHYAATVLERLDWAPAEFSLTPSLLVQKRPVVFRATFGFGSRTASEPDPWNGARMVTR